MIWSQRLMRWTGAVLVCLVCTVAQAERRVALVIGNADYVQEKKRLANPVNDAKDMYAKLQSLGFAKADIVYRENLKQADIDTTLAEFAALLGKPDTVALVYYAGHGMGIGDQNYLPAVDARIKDKLQVPRQSIAVSDLIKLMREGRSRVNLLFLDACRNDPFQRSWGSTDRGYVRSNPPAGTWIAYAAEPGRTADDGEGQRNGVFTDRLLAHIGTPGLSLEDLFRRVANDVVARTESKQVPWPEGWLSKPFYMVSPPPPPPDPDLSTPLSVPAPTVSRVGDVIKDCADCPELVLLPKGSFMMGSPVKEPEREKDEGPQRTVRINYTLAVGRYEVTQGQWKAVMGNNPSHFSACGDTCPVENVSWDMAQEYLKKLNAKSGQQYRLLSEAEWEYAARAGTTTPFHTGKTITPQQANFDGNYTYSGSAKGVYQEKTVKVGSFGANAFGLHDMHGNVWEWVQDVWHDNYTGAPTDGTAWETGGDSARRVLRGGSWVNFPWYLRSAFRNGDAPGGRGNGIGFRIARTF